MYLDWIANIFIFWGAYEIGKKHRRAFLLYLVGELLWIAWATMNDVYSLIVASTIFGCLSIWNWYRWRPRPEPVGIMIDETTLKQAMTCVKLVSIKSYSTTESDYAYDVYNKLNDALSGEKTK